MPGAENHHQNTPSERLAKDVLCTKCKAHHYIKQTEKKIHLGSPPIMIAHTPATGIYIR